MYRDDSMRVVLIIQARMSSSRFPKKMLKPIMGKPMVQWVCERASKAREVDHVILATSDDASDDALAEFVSSMGVKVFRGHLNDVLSRFIGAVETVTEATHVVRITGDCPTVDPELIDEVVKKLIQEKADYCSNINPPTFPDGMDVEAFTVSALKRAEREGKTSHHREHVTTYMRECKDSFSQVNLDCPWGDQSDHLWSVDRSSDLDYVEALFKEIGKEQFGCQALLESANVLKEQGREKAFQQRDEGAIQTLKASLEERHPAPKISASQRLWEKSKSLIPAGTQTLSKGPTQFVDGFAPKYLKRGDGAYVWDVDGNKYLDYPMGLGPVTLGHANPEVNQAMIEQLALGQSFSLMHPLEIELAEKLTSIIPCAERVRYGKNGSDATTACIRAARALTGRDVIARCGYHGWQDWSIDESYGLRAKGVPEATMAMTKPFEYNNLESLEVILKADPCAAIILEPLSITPPKEGFLEGVRELADRYEAILIFDEVITGFRYARGGAQEYFGVTPDMASMGKGMANGAPLSLVVGKEKVMRAFDDIFFSFTFGGETTALAAALKTIEIMEREDYWSHVWKVGQALQDGFNQLAKDFGMETFASCMGLAPWTVVVFQDTTAWTGLQLKSLFQQEMIRRGILFSGSQFVSLCHGEAEVQKTLEAYREAFGILKMAMDLSAVVQLTMGEAISPVFRRA